MSENEPAEDRPVACVLTVLDVQCATPFEIIPGCTFRKATADECNRFRYAVNGLSGFSVELALEAKWEGTRKVGSLDSTLWRYWMIDIPVDPMQIALAPRRIEKASILSPVYLPCSMIIYKGGSAGPSTKHGTNGFAEIWNRFISGPVPFTEEIAHQITAIDASIKKAEANQNANVLKAIDMFVDLYAVPRTQSLYTLGLFIVLESLLTHDPKPTDPTESLTRQIKNKMALLNDRFVSPVDYDALGFPAQKVWGALYSFRSCLAHGSTPNFEEKEFKPIGRIGGPNELRDFTENALKKLLVHTLSEPDLVDSLKDC